MKKSNLILLTAFIIIIITMVIMMVFLRSNLKKEYHLGNGDITENYIAVDDFEKIKIRGNYKVFFTQDSIIELKVITDSNLHEYIRTEIKRGELIIESSEPVLSKEDIRVELSNASINSIDVSGSARFHTTDRLYLTELKVVANAGARVEIEGFFERLSAIQNAGSRIFLKGESEVLELESNAGGSINAFDMEAGSANAAATAGANIDVNAKELNASASAGGSVTYMGNPVIVGINTSAGGRIRSRN
ncbi:MAG: head GIN domain-containing protein [Bacteroidales bacterium]